MVEMKSRIYIQFNHPLKYRIRLFENLLVYILVYELHLNTIYKVIFFLLQLSILTYYTILTIGTMFEIYNEKYLFSVQVFNYGKIIRI